MYISIYFHTIIDTCLTAVIALHQATTGTSGCRTGLLPHQKKAGEHLCDSCLLGMCFTKYVIVHFVSTLCFIIHIRQCSGRSSSAQPMTLIWSGLYGNLALNSMDDFDFRENSNDSYIYDTLQACASISVSKRCNFHLPYLVNFVKN